MKTDNITFSANPISKVKIKKFDKKSNKFINYQATFVKIDPDNFSDIKALDNTANLWTDAKYIKKIVTASHWLKTIPAEIYAITTQKDKFKTLKSGKILGFAEMRKEDKLPDYKWLYYLQVKPEAINVNNPGKKNYKYVGTSIIKSLKKIYKNITLYSEDNLNIENFYKKNGFIKDNMGIRHYRWSSNLFTRLKIYWQNFITQYSK